MPARYSFFFRRTGGREEDASDLAQDFFLLVWEKAARWQEKAEVRPWLFTIAYHQLTDYYRRQGYLETYLALYQQAEGQDGEELLSSRLDKAAFDIALTKVLATLPEAEQMLFDLRYMEELPISEIATVLEVPEGTVKSRLHTLIVKLRQKLQDYE